MHSTPGTKRVSRQALFLSLALVSLVLVEGVVIVGGRVAENATALRAQTYDALLAISAIDDRKARNETLARIYVWTGLKPITARLESGIAEFDQLLPRARALVAESSTQPARLDQLAAKAREFHAQLKRTVEVRSRDDAAAASQILTQEVGGLSEEIKAILDTITAEEKRRLGERTTRAESYAKLCERIAMTGGVMTVLFALFAVRAINTQARERARADAQAVEAVAQFRVLTENSPEAIFIHQAGRVVFANPAGARLLGFPSVEPLRGCAMIDFVRADFHPTVRERLAALAGGRPCERMSLVYLRHDGTEVPVEVSEVSAMFNGQPAVHVIAHDLTEIHAAAAATLASQQQLQAAVRRHEQIMQHSGDMICTIDGAGCFVFVSAACERILGFGPAELAGRAYLDLVHPDDRPKTQFAAAEIMAGRPVREFENRYRRKDGSLVPMGWSASWAPGDALMFCVAHDVTERKRAEAALREAHDGLRRANEELAQASRLKDEFLANMSHELRTPLNAILGLSEALLEQVSGPLTARQVKSITTISSSGQHLLALINDILDLSKIEAGKLELNPEPVNVQEFCESCLSFVRTQALEKKIGVVFEHDGRVANLMADAKRLKQLLVNLLTNAVKFTPESGRIGLTVAAPADEDVMRFTVWDTGIGIAAADQRKLFRSFTQIDSGLTRAQEGTGLGLALVAKLVELHGGSVALESEPGKGSRFIVTLPLVAAPAPPAPASELDRRTYRRALVIEDDPISGALLVDYLAHLGLTTVLHVRGDESLEAVLREQPDVILLDVQLPGESGWTVLERLKGHPSSRDIPVVVISVVDEPEKSRALGAAAHFTKPVARMQLAEFLQRPTPPSARRTSRSPFKIPGSGPLLLLAEDNEANIQTIGGYLEDKRYAMHYATNGLIAVKRARELRPALILMDMQMPVMDGLTAIREIRADAALAHIPIVALTALAMPGDRERCLDAGATDYMSKPVSLKALAGLVERLLPGGEARVVSKS